MARKVLDARSRANLPLTIWIVDNSASMRARDGRLLVRTKSQDTVRTKTCTRMDELRETVAYHARLAALLEAPTKFVPLNPSDSGAYPREFSIAERGPDWIEEDMDELDEYFPKVRPKGATPLTEHLLRIYLSLEHLQEKIVVVVATDGRPTDILGFVSPAIDKRFTDALKKLQTKAWIVVRLCTNDETVLKFYQTLDDQDELELEVLDDFIDEAKEIYKNNPWLSYGLCLHRCREMGMSCHPMFKFLDRLDETPLSREEIATVSKTFLGFVNSEHESVVELVSHSDEDWKAFCDTIGDEQERLDIRRQKFNDHELMSFYPWNPIRNGRTHWMDLQQLRKHRSKKYQILYSILLVVPIVFVAMYFNTIYQ